MLVEFVGPPAAGKTTISASVADSLRATGYSVSEPTRRIAQQDSPRRIVSKAQTAGKYALTHPRTAFSDCRNIYSTKQESVRDLVKTTFNWHYIRGLTNHQDPDITLFDQGLFQALWSIGYRSSLSWEQALRCVQLPANHLPDLVVIVQADEEALLSRLGEAHQSKTRVSQKNQAEIEHALAGIEHLTTLIEEYETNSDIDRTLKVTNSSQADISAIARTVANTIDEHIQSN